MKKSVIAIAVGAALVAAGVANAEVVLSGEGHMSLDQLNDGKYKRTSVSSNVSSLAITASEDLGDGMKATVFLEQTVSMDTGKQNAAYKDPTATCTTKATGTGTPAAATYTTTCTNAAAGTAPSASSTASANGNATAVWDKQSYVMFSGGFGGVTLGRMESPVKKMSRKIDPFNNQIGDSRNIIAAGSKADLRSSNSVVYTTPAMSGVAADLLWMPSQGKDSAGNDYKDGGYQVVVNYTQGPLYIAAGRQKLNEGNSSTVTTPGTILDKGNTTVTSSNAANIAADEKMTRLVVSAAVTPEAKVMALWQSITAANGALYKKSLKDNLFYYNNRKAYGLSGTYKVGSGLAKLSYYKLGQTSAGADGAKEIALGYEHSLSKNTLVYVDYAFVKNDDYGNAIPYGAGHGNYATGASAQDQPAAYQNSTTKVYSDPKAISLGVKVKF